MTFQSTHPRRVWQKGYQSWYYQKRFQSTHPRRVWLISSICSGDFHCFNPHTHAGCDWNSGWLWSALLCFNPHTHAGCDAVGYFDLISSKVSIHTPTQGVTILSEQEQWILFVSIHTPTQGVTGGYIDVTRAQDGFNPHTHAGCDDKTMNMAKTAAVSIHTPTQGVTYDTSCCWPLVCVSIHTPTQGVTIQRNYDSPAKWFQSTHPRRVWQLFDIKVNSPQCFNPHTHAGCDVGTIIFPNMRRCFNPHTHAGCDILNTVWLLTLDVSIHTPTQGVTFSRTYSIIFASLFQSTHPRRVWPSLYRNALSSNQFQSTHPRRVWQKGYQSWYYQKRFQSTHPRRVWR